MPISYVGAAVGAGNLALGISNAVSGGPGTSGGSSSTYIPQNQGAADQFYSDIFGQQFPYATALPGQVIPGYQQYAANIQNNPYAAAAQGGANTAAGYGTAGAGQQVGAANQLFGAGSQVLGTGFDPQQGLYNRGLQQLTDQSNAINSQYGLSSSPAGAGITDQAINNYNLGWQNQQLGRQTQALGAAGQNATTAGNLSNLGYSTEATASGLPYSTYLGQQNQDIGALQGLVSGTSGAFLADQNLINNLNSYLGLGQSATAQGLVGQQQGFNQQMQLGNLAGQTIGSIGNLSSLFAPTTAPYTGGGYNYSPSAGYSYGADTTGGSLGDFNY